MKRTAVLLVATGIASTVSAGELASPPRGCSAIEVTAPGLGRPPRNLRFSTSQVLDLEFSTELQQATYGSHVLHFKVTTPGGSLYQDLAMPFNWRRPGKGPRERQSDGVMRASSDVAAGVPVQQLGCRGHGPGTHEARGPPPVAG